MKKIRTNFDMIPIFFTIPFTYRSFVYELHIMNISINTILIDSNILSQITH